MITVDYQAGDIGAHPAHSGTLQVSVEHLVDAAIGVGIHPNWNPSPHRWTNAFDARWRIDLLQAILTWNTGPVRKTGLYVVDLDPTEKGYASYHTGMVFALVWAREVLNVLDLAHVDRLLEGLGHRLRGRRPDLLSDTTAGTLYAVEAKGRSGVLSTSLAAGKRQIDEADYWFSLGGVPATGVVTATYFEADDGPMQMAIVDPVANADMYPVDSGVIRAAALEPYAEAITREAEILEFDDGLIGAIVADTGVLVALTPEAQPALELVGTRPHRVQATGPAERQVGETRISKRFADVRTDITGPVVADELPGSNRYRVVADQLGPRRADTHDIEYGQFRGIVRQNGVAILLDETWPAASRE